MEQNQATMFCVVSDHEAKATHNHHLHHDHHEASAAANYKSSRGRKPSNKPQKIKKQPQRGMGVEKLERERLKELAKIAEMPPLESPTSQNDHFRSSSHLAAAVPPAGPVVPSVPLMHGAGHYCVPPGSVFVGNGLLGGNLGQAAQFLYCTGGSGQVLMSNIVGTSKELSSMPKKMLMHQQPWSVLPQQRCESCSKLKKRFHGDGKGFHHGVEGKHPEASPICYGVPAYMSQENNLNFYGGINGGSEARAARSAVYAGHYHHHYLQNHQGTAQAAVIHRNGIPMSRNVPREYEFLPGKGDTRNTSTSSKEQASVAVFGDQAPWFNPAPPAYSNANATSYSNANATSNSIDLSLKLSL